MPARAPPIDERTLARSLRRPPSRREELPLLAFSLAAAPAPPPLRLLVGVEFQHVRFQCARARVLLPEFAAAGHIAEKAAHCTAAALNLSMASEVPTSSIITCSDHEDAPHRLISCAAVLYDPPGLPGQIPAPPSNRLARDLQKAQGGAAGDFFLRLTIGKELPYGLSHFIRFETYTGPSCRKRLCFQCGPDR